MKDLLDKLSSYNIFNYLLPGILYAILLSEFSVADIIQEDFITGAFLYYFIGVAISRVGSLVVEPILLDTRFIKFESYSDFIKSEKKDSKIDELSASNNMYRTLIALILSLLVSKLFLQFASVCEWCVNNIFYILMVPLLVIFLFAYRKHTKYITNRIKHHENKSEDNGKSL